MLRLSFYRAFSTSVATTSPRCAHRPLQAMKAGPRTIGSVGFGGTLKPGMRAPHIQEQFETFLRLGGNFVEMIPGTEQTLGEALREAFVRDLVDRNKIIICTTFPRRLDSFLDEVPMDFKPSAYFTPDPFKAAIAKMPELSEAEAEMDPLLFQLERQLQLNFDLSQQTLDVVLVDLDILKNDLLSKEDYSKDNLYAQIGVVFDALKKKVEEGEILAFGVRSEHFTSDSDLNLSDVLTSGGKDLKFISAPVNLCESLFVSSSSSSSSSANSKLSLLSVAKENGLCVLSTRCWETRDKNGQGILLKSLPSTDKTGNMLSRELKTAFDHACQWERSAVDLYKKIKEVRDDFNFEWACWGHRLTEHPEYLQDLVLWERALNYRILPYLHVALGMVAADPKLVEWVQGYKKTCLKLFEVYTECAEFGQKETTEQISKLAGHYKPLQNQALATVLNSGVDCVLMTDFKSASKVAGAQQSPEEVAEIFKACSRFGPDR